MNVEDINVEGRSADELAVLRVEDEINEALAGHDGCCYESPAQPRQQALTLARALLGYAGQELNGDETWSCPIAGGRRVVSVRPLDRQAAQARS